MLKSLNALHTSGYIDVPVDGSGDWCKQLNRSMDRQREVFIAR